MGPSNNVQDRLAARQRDRDAGERGAEGGRIGELDRLRQDIREQLNTVMGMLQRVLVRDGDGEQLQLDSDGYDSTSSTSEGQHTQDNIN